VSGATSPNGVDVTAISLWDNKGDAEAYNTNTYPEFVKIFSKLIDGTPKVQTCEVVNSLHSINRGRPFGGGVRSPVRDRTVGIYQASAAMAAAINKRAPIMIAGRFDLGFLYSSR
jgi:hypothetical protein